ncbi:MAG: MarR family winged helix-turn-helix transcriptional regulator [Leptothrix sp. (in: b-proteobacteria)]
MPAAPEPASPNASALALATVSAGSAGSASSGLLIAASDSQLRLDQQLCFALYAASLAMTKRYRPHLDALGLTYPQYLVLLALWERDRRSVGELGEQLALDSGTLTPLLKRLEAAGHLQRLRSPSDERRVEVHLTDAGRALKQPARALPPQIAAAAGCSLDELRSLTQQLQALRASLGAADD